PACCASRNPASTSRSCSEAWYPPPSARVNTTSEGYTLREHVALVRRAILARRDGTTEKEKVSE
ncbi:MAG: hypothetical protein ABWY12_01920, partial [Burkholderiales bacterium]